MLKKIVVLLSTLFCLAISTSEAAIPNRVFPDTPEELYLELMKYCVMDGIYRDLGTYDPFVKPDLKNIAPYNPRFEQTMMGRSEIDKLHELMNDIRLNGIEGDFIETGVWRGGLTIFMRAFLKAYGDKTRKVWVADSFQGLPKPNPQKYPADKGLDLTGVKWLSVSMEEVQANFARYGLLDDQVCFLKGWFSQTLPSAPIQSLAILRLDGDLYESTMDALIHLYPKLSKGGYIIIDDFGAVPACAKAVNDYRGMVGITDIIYPIDWTGVFWKKS